MKRPVPLILLLLLSAPALFHPFSYGDEIEIETCDTRYVRMAEGPTQLDVCVTAEVSEERYRMAREISEVAFRLIEEYYGRPYEFDFMRIELGHQGHAAMSGLGTVRMGWSGTESTINWLMIHEMIHNFWHSAFSTTWISEGTANHGATRIRAEILGLHPSIELWNRRNRVWETIEERGFQDLLLKDTHDNYAAAARLGDVFMIDLFLLMGRENFDAAYQDLYTQKLADPPVDERDFARAFIAHCPEERKCEMWELFVERMDDSYYFFFNMFLCRYAHLGIFALFFAAIAASLIVFLRFIMNARPLGSDSNASSGNPD